MSIDNQMYEKKVKHAYEQKQEIDFNFPNIRSTFFKSFIYHVH